MRLVDADKLYPDVMKADGSIAISQSQLAHAKPVEAIPKADYEARLKADMLAMLTDLQLEIEEIEISKSIAREDIYWDMGAKTMREKINCIIQQKIRGLEGNQ